MKKRMILFGVLTLMGTGASFAFSNGSTSKTADKSFCEDSCPPECCTTAPTGSCKTDACCYDPSCCE
ncbi:MAG: hypothetical protein A3D31_02145 [Candidatus Fluviicola riflensis]|nr:MAG: hypothetical protein CHH17_12890 [Candidatus Fluviicola riflensis]OGS78797.1 MAG: hypothetical protein A3D31_02145 [Candidatus Fluviicola riflensis]OGS85819.1 MAG: hypothetical protein A3E30_09630 [Fluviicola sp. RIFCSPHIGHO2_12_FULL_43_24]OGS86228.1 MAG: hypothetical protein A2724_01600 [Fluviicola sp. RIFCSPHIGHO2_01_FULL_43_53]